MRKAAAAALLLCMTAASASAQGYNPHAGSSVAPSPGTVVAPLTPNGVDWLNSQLGLSTPILNAQGEITADIRSALGTFGFLSQTAYPSVYIGQDMTAVLGSPLVGNMSVQIGGAPMPSVTGSPLSQAALPQSLVISAHPDGPFNNGCGLCVFTSGAAQNLMLAELGGDDYETGLVPAGFDTAGIYWEANARQARLILPATAYTSTTVTLSGKLSKEQMLLIHQGQYIVTNSSDPVTTAAETWTAPQFLAGVVRSVDNTGTNAVITVWAWNRLGQSGDSKTPSLTSLDTFYFPKTTTPTVFIGAPTKVFGFNTMMQYDGANTGAGTTDTSAVHQLEWGEVDVNFQNETRAGALSYHGLTFGGGQTVPSGATISTFDVFTSDSYEMMLANDMPHHLIVNEACGNMAIESSGFYLPGKCNLFAATKDANGMQATDIVEYMAQSANTTTGAAYNWRIPMYLTSSDGAYDYTHDTLHFGPRINGTQGLVNGTDAASVLGEVQFPGMSGGVSLCGYGSNCGLIMGGNGTLAFTNNTTASGQFTATGNFITRGTQYYQDSSADNIAQMVGQKDATSGDTVVTLSGLGQNAHFNIDMPTNLNADLLVTGGLTSHGNTTLGGYGGTIALKDSVTASGAMNVVGSLTVNGIVVATGLGGTGNAYACLNASGQLYRSSTACQ